MRGADLVRTPHVHLDDEVPVLILHVLEAHVSQNARVVDQYIDAAELPDGGFNDLLAIVDAVVVGSCFAASGPNLVDDDVGSLRTLLTTLLEVPLAYET
jgi:hypothetical protein